MAMSKPRQFSTGKGICHMSEDTITILPDPSGCCQNLLTGVIRDGARKLIEKRPNICTYLPLRVAPALCYRRTCRNSLFRTSVVKNGKNVLDI